MSSPRPDASSQARTAAAVVLGVQAVLSALAGLALLAAAHRRPRRGFAAGGLVVLLVAAGLVAVAVAVVGRRSWARPVGLGFEGFVALVALTRIGARPVASIVGVAVAGAAIFLLTRLDSDPRGPLVEPPYPTRPDPGRPPSGPPA